MRELKRKLDGLVRLTRFKEYLFFVTVTTLLGATASYGYFGLKLLAVLFANICAVAFSFMINDVEDAPDDALNPEKINRNPVSSNTLSRRTAWRVSWLVAVVAAFLYLLVGWMSFIMGMICLSLGFFYSWRSVRFKNLPIIDMLSHCMMLAGLQYLAAYFAFNLASFDRWFFPFMFVTCVSLYGELFNEIRDLDGDLKAGLRHTAALLGPKPTYWIMISVMGMGIASAIYMLFIGKLIAPWVCYLTLGLAVVLLIIPLVQFRRHRNAIKFQESLQKPLEIAAALSLLAQFVAPWARIMLRW